MFKEIGKAFQEMNVLGQMGENKSSPLLQVHIGGR
jgi:hypothetical protein